MDDRGLMLLLPQFTPLLKPKRYKGAKGGRASGKSHHFASMIVKACITYQDFNVVCIREIQKSLKFSAKKLIEDKIKEEGISKYFDITQTEIKCITGSLIIFQGMQDHTAESIKSLEGFDVAWIEEAQSISHRSLELLLPTIRAKGSEIWFSWNPTYEDDPVEQLFNGLDDTNSIVVSSNYYDNKYITDTVIEEAERHKRTNPETFDHVWLGGYKASNAGSVYKFVRDRNETDIKALEGETLLIGQDFNIGGCCSAVAIVRNDKCYIIDEIISNDTSDVVKNIKERYKDRSIVIYPDASGKAQSTNAARSDIDILKQAGFKVNAPKANGRVMDRVNTVNEMLTTGRLCINTKTCPNITKALVKQQYDDNGIPEKFSGAGTIDDWVDSLGYLIVREFSMRKPKVQGVTIDYA